MRWFLAVLLVVLGLTQYRLWFAEGSLAEQRRLRAQVEEFTEQNRKLQARNAKLAEEVLELQRGDLAVERRAREELGLIREDEVFYQFVDSSELPTRPDSTAAPAAGNTDEAEEAASAAAEQDR